MKISANMDLVELANIVGSRASADLLGTVRARLVMMWKGQDSSSLSESDWLRVLNFEYPSGVEVDNMLANSGLYWVYYNRRTGAFYHGVQDPPRSGDRSVDRSWVAFEVISTNKAAAEQWVRAYVAHPKARYKGMFVGIRDGVAENDEHRLDLVLPATS